MTENKESDNIIFSKEYIWKKHGKIHLVSFKINNERQYKIDIKTYINQKGTSTDAIIQDKKPEKLHSGKWINEYGEMWRYCDSLFDDEGLEREFAILTYDYVIEMKTEAHYTDAPLFKRLYLLGEYPTDFTRENVLDNYWRKEVEYNYCSTTEFWLIGYDITDIYARTIKRKPETVQIWEEGRITCFVEHDDWLYRLREASEDEFPKNTIYKWILKKIIKFYYPIILEKLKDSKYFPNVLCDLIAKYVIS